MRDQFVRRSALCAVGIVSLAAASANAGVVWSAASGARSCSADFTISGTQLIVTLSNDALGDAGVPTDILTGVYFDIKGSALSLSRISAVLPAGSSALVCGTGAAAPIDPGNSVGGEWAYLGGLAGAPHGAKYGISSSGLGLFGPGDCFAGNNLEGPASPDGVQYGITTTGDNIMTGNGGISGSGLIKHVVKFVIDGVPSVVSLADIGNVSFQYGTDLSEPNLQGSPTPGTIALLGTSAIIGGRRRRR